MVPGSSPLPGATEGPRVLGPLGGLDGLRGVAILAVLAMHISFLDRGSSTWTLRGGFLGVDLFLGLSAFLIAAVLLREIDTNRPSHGGEGGTVAQSEPASAPFDARSFARRRFRRLYPPMILLLLVSGLVWVCTEGGLGARIRQSLPAVASLANWQRSWDDPLPFDLVHLWSLSLEAQFYLLMAIGFWFGHRRLRGWRTVGVLVAASGVVWLWRLWLYERGVELVDLYEHTGARADAMLLGVAAAVIWRDRLLSERAANIAGVLAGVFLVGAMVFGEVDDPWLYRGGFTVLAAAAALVVMAVATGPGPVALVGGWAPLRWVGEISYSLYLWHLPVYIWTVMLLGDETPLAAKLALALPGSFLAGWASYRLVERRTLAAWRRR